MASNRVGSSSTCFTWGTNSHNTSELKLQIQIHKYNVTTQTHSTNGYLWNKNINAKIQFHIFKHKIKKSMSCFFSRNLLPSYRVAHLAASWQPGSEEMERERGNGERMRKWREIHSLHFLIFSLFPSSLSISYIKNCLILSQNAKYGTFVAEVKRNLSYSLWKNNSESNSLR